MARLEAARARYLCSESDSVLFWLLAVPASLACRSRFAAVSGASATRFDDAPEAPVRWETWASQRESGQGEGEGEGGLGGQEAPLG